MTGEASWTECATQVMEGREDQSWFTVQAIVTEIRERNMKPSMHRLPANEACRSLRSCLRHHAMKDNGKFVRKNSNSLIQYALRKGVHSKKQPHTKSNVKSSCNACPPALNSGPLIVEVDNPNIPKPYRPRHPRDASQAGFLLPSPSLSLLGAPRTLRLMSAGESCRPVRKTRGRGERVRDRPQENAGKMTENTDKPSQEKQPCVYLEEQCTIETEAADIVFFKSSYNGGPANIQGDRESCTLCKVDPDLWLHSDLSSSSSCSDDSEMTETCSEDGDDDITFPHDVTSPPSDHHVTRSPLTSHTQPVVTMTTVGRRSEIDRHLSHLLSPSSPLVGENLKLLLGVTAFEGLTSGQRSQLTTLLPTIDVDSSGRIQPVALSNSFFGSSCREWQDHLILGLHGNIGGRSSRAEKKSRNYDNLSWKERFFESHWGERLSEVVTEREEESVFFPCDSDDHTSQCLCAILEGYQSHAQATPLPPSPPVPPPYPPPSKTATAGRNVASTKQKVKPRVRPAVRRTEKQRKQLMSLEKNNRHKPIARKLGGNHLVLFNKKTSDRCTYLSPLPHKMSYVTLLDALHRASRHHTTPVTGPTTISPSPLITHTHSVFLDHFSTLHADSVPVRFLTSLPSPPSSELVVSLPRYHYTALCASHAILSEHNYTPLNPHPPTLPLSLPRSFLPPPPPHLATHSSQECVAYKLTQCSTCNALYHGNCSHGNLCPSCTRRHALT